MYYRISLLTDYSQLASVHSVLWIVIASDQIAPKLFALSYAFHYTKVPVQTCRRLFRTKYKELLWHCYNIFPGIFHLSVMVRLPLSYKIDINTRNWRCLRLKKQSATAITKPFAIMNDIYNNTSHISCVVYRLASEEYLSSTFCLVW